jgi:hypothetical protein
MLIAGILQFDDQGRILVALPPSVDFNGGTPTTLEGFLAVDTDADPDVFLAGIGYMDNGNVVDTDTALDPGSGPLTNQRGQIRAGSGAPAYWYAGLPFTIDGHLSIAQANPPVDTGAFSNAFSNAFDRIEP